MEFKSIQKYRSWYALFLRLYPRGYRMRFGESMEQTFTDILREHSEEGNIFSVALWMFVETFIGILKENFKFIFMTQSKKIVRGLIVSTILLLVPFLASLLFAGWNWSGMDYVFAWIMFSLVCLGFSFALGNSKSVSYKLAVCLAVLTGFLLIWINAAVGIIGEDEWPNFMYPAIILIGLIGAGVTKLESRKFSKILFTIGILQILTPVIALLFAKDQMIMPPGPIKAFILNAIFSILWIASGMLFRKSYKNP